jgi:PAS domain S-box-containing protein
LIQGLVAHRRPIGLQTLVRFFAGLMVVAITSPGAIVLAEQADVPPSTTQERLSRLTTLAPEDNPSVFIELARKVLADLSGSQEVGLEAEIRARLGRALRLDERFNEAVTELRISIDLADGVGQSELKATALADLARALFHLGEFDDCLAACRQALALEHVAGDPDRSWVFQNIIASVQLQQGDFDSAIETSSEALEGRERVGDQRAAAILLNNIGVAHMYLGDHESALEYFHRARVIKAGLGETDGVADMLANIGDIKQLQGHPEEAIEIHLEALRLREGEGSELRIGLSHRSLAAAMHDAGRDREALSHVDEALARLRRLDTEPEVAASLAIKAEILAALGRGTDAVAAADESLDLARRMGMKGREVVALDAMVEARLAAGDPKSALAYQSEARALESELVVSEIRTEFAEFQAAYEARERQAEIELLRKNNELQSLELRHHRLWRNSLIIGLVLFAVIAVAGWERFLSQRRENRQRDEANTALLQIMERYRSLFERNLAGVFQADLDGRIATANPAFASMLGYDNPDHLAGLTIAEVAAFDDEIRGFLDEIGRHREVPNLELTLTDRNGKPVSILMNARRVEGSEGPDTVIEGIAIDISDRKRAEEDRRRLEIDAQQSQKLESLGVLAGGIAHDFNNMLMAILSNISLAKRSADGSDEILKRLNEAEEVCLRATGLTQQLLTFSKGGRPIRRAATIAELVEESASFVTRGGNCSIDFRATSDLWFAEIDEGQIAQVIQNLVSNAVDAMPYGGIITVKVDNVHLGEGDVPALEPGRFVCVEVEDTGSGIADAELDRIFDPFYTTKSGRSGLGLATAFSIVRSHGGAIVVHSQEDQGSRFAVYLPASDKTHIEAPDERGALKGHGRLLIMDDDEAVRSAAAELLETIGYSVSTASDGAEAVSLYSEALEAGRCFDAVVLDLTVPEGVGGRETMARLLAIDPEVKAIVSSGYSTDPVMANYREHGFSGVAVKPYRLAELVRTLNNLLGTGRP